MFHGNITSKSDAGGFNYGEGGAGPHALTSVDNPLLSIPTFDLDIQYNPFRRVKHIQEEISEVKEAFFAYGPDEHRVSMSYYEDEQLQYTRFYCGNFEKQVNAADGSIREWNYISSPSGLTAILITDKTDANDPGTSQMLYVTQDHLGSITGLIDSQGNLLEEFSYDSWGRRRNPSDWTDYTVTPSQYIHRGYTGHEQLDEFGIINMNARLYDPVTGRMLSPDNYVQSPGFSQSYNRYSYVWNNPMKYTDPSGDVVITAGVIFTAYVISLAATASQIQAGYINGPGDFFIASGFNFGATLAGSAIATSGIAGANTLAIVGGSTISSTGSKIITKGESDFVVGFGAGSYNFDKGEFGYLGKKGNSTLENIGYGLGALANVADILAGLNPGNVELRTENDPNYYKMLDADGNPVYQKDLIGHSQLVDAKGKPVVDWGPDERLRSYTGSVRGTNRYTPEGAIPASKMKWDPLTIDGVNTERISNWSPAGKYNLVCNSCVTQASRALNASGAFNIGGHPYLLHSQMYLRSIGVRPMLYSHYLY